MKKRLAQLLEDIASASIIIIGDVMLDEYIIGDYYRISPEAPEPIIEEHERAFSLGGAANVAANVISLGGKVRLFGIIGDDREGELFRKKLSDAGIEGDGIFTVENRPTTRKTRLIARGNQVFRVDRETTVPIDVSLEKKLIARIIDCPEEVVVISDYAKGIVTPGLVRSIIATGKRIIVDPKLSDFSIYSGAYLVTPNFSELFRAAGITNITSDILEDTARNIIEKFNISNLLVTRGSEGMFLIENNETACHIHTKAREVYDVTGAGDTVVAAVASSVAAGTTLSDACFIANIAAGIVVGKHQTASVSPREILDYAFDSSSSEKIIERKTLMNRVKELKGAGLKLVFTNGCFDLLHFGHITYLNEARSLGDILIVGLNTDSSVRRLKGKNRPIIPEDERSHVIAALECVDYVVLFDEDTPLDIIKDIRPDILVKGADYRKEEVVGHDIVTSYGGTVHLMPLANDTSTSSIINRIRKNLRNG